MILQYLEQTQHTQLKHISSIAKIDDSRFVHIDSFLGLTDIDADRAVDILSNKV